MSAAISYEEVECPVGGLVGPCHIYNGHKDSRGYGRKWTGSGTSLVHKQQGL